MRKRSSGSSARGRADERDPYNTALRAVFSSDLHGRQVDLPSAASGHGSGLGNLPRHGALLVANHASNWDPLVLATALPMDYRLRVMGKEELFQNPILAWVIRVGGAFPVNRGGADIQAVKTAIQTIQSGQNLLIFPEGTTVRNGIGKADGLPAHAHSGAAVIGVRTGAILVPVFVDGEKRTFRRTRIIIGQPYTPVYTGRRGTAEEMQKIADDLLREIYALGGQQVGGAPLCK